MRKIAWFSTLFFYLEEMKMTTELFNSLKELESVLKDVDLWDQEPISSQKLTSTQPFSIDTLEAYQWLQWIFIPKMTFLIEQNHPLPRELSVSPYIEEVYKNHDALELLLKPLLNIEALLKQGQ